ETVTQKKAVLKPTENGEYRIVELTDITTETTGKSDGGSNTAQQLGDSGKIGNNTDNAASAQVPDSASVREVYQKVLSEQPSDSYYFVHDINSDGIQELVVGKEIAETAFIYHQFNVYSCEYSN